jgi:hypothetical protein
MTEKNQEQCCCETAASPAPHQDECCCDMPEKLLQLADEAWMEVLKEKIKKQIADTSGEKLDEIARLVTETNCAKWQNMIAGKVQCEEYKANLKKMMTTECKK